MGREACARGLCEGSPRAWECEKALSEKGEEEKDVEMHHVMAGDDDAEAYDETAQGLLLPLLQQRCCHRCRRHGQQQRDEYASALPQRHEACA